MEVVFLFISLLVSNLIPDYISLLQTRYIINKMIKSSSFKCIAIWIAVDFLFTFLISILGITLCVYWNDYHVNYTSLYSFMLAFLKDLIYFNDETTISYLLSIIFYTSFVSYIWIWLYVLSVLLSTYFIT